MFQDGTCFRTARVVGNVPVLSTHIPIPLPVANDLPCMTVTWEEITEGTATAR